MSAELEMSTLNLYKGLTIKEANEVLEKEKLKFEQEKTQMRIRLCGLTIGD